MQKHRLMRLVLILWVCTLAVAEEIQVQDLVGRTVTLSSIPTRIVCIAPGSLRLIIYLAAQDKVVGVEDIEKRFPTRRPYWIAHHELGRLPSVGPGGVNSINKEPALEKILALAPELIVISYMEKHRADALQKKLNIPVLVLSYGPFGSFDDTVYTSLRIAGKVLGKDQRAEAVITFIQDIQKDLRLVDDLCGELIDHFTNDGARVVVRGSIAVYERRGWTADGVPTLETLAALGIDLPDVKRVVRAYLA